MQSLVEMTVEAPARLGLNARDWTQDSLRGDADTVQIMSALSISLSGLQAAGQRFEASARRIVAAGAQAGNALVEASGNGAGQAGGQGGAPAMGAPGIGFSPDMAGAMVDMMQAENAFKANARVAGRISDMQKAYLDMMAERTDG